MRLYIIQFGERNVCGRNIRKLREKAGVSQEQLAAKLQLLGHNISQKAKSRTETGDRMIPEFELILYSEVLNIPIHILFDLSR
ncbi:MAG: helix-turn-helix transcriptional regulator [Lachnospiraceae bacterium]|nr:helix-turn-helix transcriptional regulator [Lachnospiraceae bacterium]